MSSSPTVPFCENLFVLDMVNKSLANHNGKKIEVANQHPDINHLKKKLFNDTIRNARFWPTRYTNNDTLLTFNKRTLGLTWDIRTVERLSVHLIDLCRLNHNKNCGSTCQTLAGSRTIPQPAIICLVNGQNTEVVAFRLSDTESHYVRILRSTCKGLQVF